MASHTVISAKEVMLAVSLICLSVCLLAGLCINLLADFHKIRGMVALWPQKKLLDFGCNPGARFTKDLKIYLKIVLRSS